MCSFSFLFRDLFPMAARQSTFWQKQTASGSSSTSSPARSSSGGSQFHWPEEEVGSLQPTTAHGPRFGPRPPLIATAKRSTRDREAVRGDREAVPGPGGKIFKVIWSAEIPNKVQFR